MDRCTNSYQSYTDYSHLPIIKTSLWYNQDRYEIQKFVVFFKYRTNIYIN